MQKVLSSNLKAYITLALVAVLYGGNIVSARVVSHQIPSITLAAIRGVLGLCILVPFAWKELSQNKPNLKELMTFALLGFLGIVLPYTSLVWGMRHSSAINGSIILATAPAMTVTLLAIGWGIKPSVKQILGIITSFLGLLVVFSKGSLGDLFSLNLNAYDFILVINVISGSFFNIIGDDVMKKYSPLVTSVYSVLFGSILLLPFGCWQSDFYSWNLAWWDYLLLLYMGTLVTGGAMLLNLKGIKAIGSGNAAILVNLSPVFGILFGVVFLNESLYLYHGIGILFVFIGIVFSLSQKKFSLTVKEYLISQKAKS